jgi:hypothetical protein
VFSPPKRLVLSPAGKWTSVAGGSFSPNTGSSSRDDDDSDTTGEHTLKQGRWVSDAADNGEAFSLVEMGVRLCILIRCGKELSGFSR